MWSQAIEAPFDKAPQGARACRPGGTPQDGPNNPHENWEPTCGHLQEALTGPIFLKHRGRNMGEEIERKSAAAEEEDNRKKRRR